MKTSTGSIYRCSYVAPVGIITAAASDNALIGLWFEGQKYYPCGVDSWVLAPDYPILAELQTWLDGYFAGDTAPFAGKINPLIFNQQGIAAQNSPFQKEVWDELLRIPYGTTTTYGAIAQTLAASRGRQRFSAQAVGGAVGHNPISIIVPCHRVVGAAGNLTGYAGGIDKKLALLKLEGAI